MKWSTENPVFVRLVAASLSCCALLACAATGWLWASHKVENKLAQVIAKVERQYNLPVQIGEVSLGVGGAHLEDIRIGHGAPIVIDEMYAKLGLNPFRKDFGKVSNLEINRIYSKLDHTSLTRSADAKFPSKNGPGETTGQARPLQIDLHKLMTRLPVSRSITLNSAYIGIYNQARKPILQAQELKLVANPRRMKLSAQIGRLVGPRGELDRHLNVSMQLHKQRADQALSFKVIKRPPEGPTTWAVKGTSDRFVRKIDATYQALSLPRFIGDRFDAKLSRHKGAQLSGAVSLVRPGENWAWHTEGRVQTLVPQFQIARLHHEPLRNLSFDLNWQALIDPSELFVGFDRIELGMGPRDQQGVRAVRFEGGGHGRIIKDELDWFPKLDLWGRLHETECTNLLAAAPKGFLGPIPRWNWAGRARGQFRLLWDDRSPDDSTATLDRTLWTCNIEHPPAQLTHNALSNTLRVTRPDRRGKSRNFDIGASNQMFVEIQNISRNVVNALITSEDASFYRHKGVDLYALEQAILKNLTARRIAVGGSTITMQLVKNLFLSPRRTLARKAKEMLISGHIERTVSKDRILELYLNLVEFGPGIYGIRTASEHFFDKHPLDLNTKEAAYLVALLPSPKQRYKHYCAGTVGLGYQDLMDDLLKRMLNLRRLSLTQYMAALNDSLVFNSTDHVANQACQKFDLELDSVHETDQATMRNAPAPTVQGGLPW